jgi:endonuclease-8
MPEGDTIYRAAATLHRALAGRRVVRFESMFPALTRVHDDHPLTAMTVDQVRSAGKHLLMHFSGDLVLRTHMRMNGSWHIYRPGERWRRHPRDMRILLATPAFEAVGFNIPVAEFIKVSSQRDLARHEVLSALGPDVLDPDFDRSEAIRRLRAQPSSSIAEALLNQRLLAGLGNVYKSEVLFACRANPFATVAELDDEQLANLVDMSRKLLMANVATPRSGITTYRRTTGRASPGERLWVYGRGRQPCRQCGAPIHVRKHGADARLTYWCPRCQTS